MAKKPVRKLKTRAVPRLEKSTPKSSRRIAAVVQTTTIVEDESPSFKDRLARMMSGRREGIDADQLAEVREGVMEELRRQGNPGQPFEGIILPAPRRRRGLSLWGLGTLTALVVLAALVWWAGRSATGGEVALHRIEEAVAAKNTAAFERLVDTPTLSANIISQVFTPAQQDADRMMTDQFEASVKAHLQSLVKPGETASLAETLHDQMLAAVSAGRFPEDPGNLLGQLWEQLGGDHLKVGHAHVVTSTANHIEAELPLSRDDIAFDVALRLVLEKKDHQWQLVDVPNLAQTMGLTDDAEAAAEDKGTEPAAGPAAEAAPAPVTADVLQAAKDGHGHVLARINMANMSGLPVHGVDVALVIGDADGRPLKQVLLHDEGSLAPTQSAEKTYTVALNTKNPHERDIAILPLTALTVRATVVGVVQ